MRTMTRTMLLAACGATLAVQAGCDSKGTKEVKREAKAIDETYKARADLVEASAKDGPDAEAAKNKAQALRDQGKVEEKHLIKEAKETQKETR